MAVSAYTEQEHNCFSEVCFKEVLVEVIVSMLKPSKNQWLHFDRLTFNLQKNLDDVSSSTTSCNPSSLRALLPGGLSCLLSLEYTGADQFLRDKISSPLPTLDPTYVLTLENPMLTSDMSFRLFSSNKPTAF